MCNKQWCTCDEYDALKASHDALEAKLADAERKAVLLGEACPEQLAALNTLTDAYYESRDRLAALRPLVRAAVLLHENEWGANDDWDALYDSTNDLTPEQVAWAKGGE